MTDANQPPVPPQQPTPPAPPAAPQYQAAPPAPPAPGYAAPQPGYGQQAPGYGGAPAPVPGKTLGTVGLIVSIASFIIFQFVGSIAGIIISAIARKKSKEAGVENTPAKVGLILGIISLVLSIIVGIIVIVVLVAAGGAVLEACSTLGPGEHYIDGVTYTCS